MRFLRWVSVFILKVSCLLRSWSLTRVFLVKPSNLRSQVLYQVLESCVMSIAAEREEEGGRRKEWYNRCRGFGSTCSLTRCTGSAQGIVG